MSARRRLHLAISEEAQRDLDDALLYTRRRWGVDQRRRYRAQLKQAMRSLLDFPELGRPRDEFYLGCRSLPVEQHVIYYYLDDDEVVIDRVLHGSQDATDKVHP